MKTNHKSILSLLFALLTICQSSGFGQENELKIGAVRSGTLAYPAEDNINFSEGTLECWVKLMVDPNPYMDPKSAFTGLLQWVSLSGEKGGIKFLYFNRNGLGVFASSMQPKDKMKPMSVAGAAFEKNVWHHLAFVWKGKEMSFYWDGEKTSHPPQLERLDDAFGSVANKTIIFGDPWHKCGLMMMDELRISTVARTPEELGFRNVPLKPDIHTSILDSFERVEDVAFERLTTPEVIHAGKSGTISKECRSTPDGKHGRALLFYE